MPAPPGQGRQPRRPNPQNQRENVLGYAEGIKPTLPPANLPPQGRVPGEGPSLRPLEVPIRGGMPMSYQAMYGGYGPMMGGGQAPMAPSMSAPMAGQGMQRYGQPAYSMGYPQSSYPQQQTAQQPMGDMRYAPGYSQQNVPTSPIDYRTFGQQPPAAPGTRMPDQQPMQQQPMNANPGVAGYGSPGGMGAQRPGTFGTINNPYGSPESAYGSPYAPQQYTGPTANASQVGMMYPNNPYSGINAGPQGYGQMAQQGMAQGMPQGGMGGPGYGIGYNTPAGGPSYQAMAGQGSPGMPQGGMGGPSFAYGDIPNPAYGTGQNLGGGALLNQHMASMMGWNPAQPVSTSMGFGPAYGAGASYQGGGWNQGAQMNGAGAPMGPSMGARGRPAGPGYMM